MGVKGQKSLLANTCPSERERGAGTWSTSFLHKLNLMGTQNKELRVEVVCGWCVPPKSFGGTRTMFRGGAGDALALCTSAVSYLIQALFNAGHCAAAQSIIVALDCEEKLSGALVGHKFPSHPDTPNFLAPLTWQPLPPPS